MWLESVAFVEAAIGAAGREDRAATISSTATGRYARNRAAI